MRSKGRWGERCRRRAHSWLACSALGLSFVGCAAILRPLVVSPTELGYQEGALKTVPVGHPMVSGAVFERHCYRYIGLLDYVPPGVGRETVQYISRGRAYGACFENSEDTDSLFLADVHRSDVWLGIQRDGFVGPKGGWWHFLGSESPVDYRAVRMFQGKWTAERLMAPAVGQIVYDGRFGDVLHLSYQVGAPEAGVPFQKWDDLSHDVSKADLIVFHNYSFRVVTADPTTISFIVMGHASSGVVRPSPTAREHAGAHSDPGSPCARIVRVFENRNVS